jgi:hypothetical protein
MKNKENISVRSPLLAPRDRLGSWKDIANHLNRNPRTVQRWERVEAMPVHRHVHEKGSSVYAFTEEVDAWQRSRNSEKRRGRRTELATISRFLTDSFSEAEEVLLHKLLEAVLSRLRDQMATSPAIAYSDKYRSPAEHAIGTRGKNPGDGGGEFNGNSGRSCTSLPSV